MPRRLIFFLVILMLLIPALVSQTQAQTQTACNPRTDWGTYAVRRGDTLFLIAKRFGTTTANLAAANCIPNINRIYSGQVLRVPTAPAGTPAPTQPRPPGQLGQSGIIPPLPLGTYDVNIGYQIFERGWMMYNVENSAVWVFYTSKPAQGIVRDYPSQTYGNLPLPTTHMLPPAGFDLPQFGFARVWYNFPDVQAALGYATFPERGVLAHIVQPTFGNYFYLALEDTNTRQVILNLEINSEGAWQITSTPVLETPVPVVSPAPYATGTTFLAFEGGFMVWSALNSEIRAYIGRDSGTYVSFPASSYGRLGIKLVAVPPTGRLVPENGFGRVWSNFDAVRSALGWATSSEQGYLSQEWRHGDNLIDSFSLPDGRIVTHSAGNQWRIG